MMTKDEYIKRIEAIVERAYAWTPPRCCATCVNLTREGRCKIYDLYPPLDYIEQVNDCEFYALYADDVPF